MIELTGMIYARRSLRRDNLSCENQIEQCLAYAGVVEKHLAHKHGQPVRITIPDEYIFSDEGQSGLDFDRREYDRMKDVIRARKAQLLIIYAIDRLGRTEEITDMFLERRFCVEHGVQVWVEYRDKEITAADDATLIQFFFDSLMARQELKNIRRRTRQGRWATWRKDPERFAFGGRLRYGYTLDKDKHIVLCEEQAGVVREMCDWLLKEYLTSHDIARRLNRRRTPAPNGKQWWVRTITRILGDPVIAGMGIDVRVTDDDATEHRIHLPAPAIITPHEFESVQRLLESRSTTPKRRNIYILTGKMICPLCGKHFIGASGGRHLYYRCLTRSKPKELDVEPCPMVIVPKRAIEEPVWDRVAYALDHPAILLEAVGGQASNQRAQVAERIGEVKKALDDQRHAQERLTLDWARARIPAAVLETSLKQVTQEIERLETELTQLEWRHLILSQESPLEPLERLVDMPLHNISERGKQRIIQRFVHRIDVEQTGERQVEATVHCYRLDSAIAILAGQNLTDLSNWTVPLPESILVDFSR